MKINRRKRAKLALVPLALMFISGRAQAQVSGNIEASLSKDPWIETNFFYNLPLKTSGFTFLDYTFKDKGFFGKTTLSTKLNDNLSAEFQAVHANEPFTKGGLGVCYKLPIKLDRLTAKVSFLPLWMSKKGEILKNQVDLKYFVGIKLPKDFSVSTFGQFNVRAKGKNPQWGYGEVEVNKKFGKDKKWEASYNPSLTNRGRFAPEYTHKIALRRHF